MPGGLLWPEQVVDLANECQESDTELDEVARAGVHLLRKAGADRIGTSSSIQIIEQFKAGQIK